jgi:hypothetical protein
LEEKSFLMVENTKPTNSLPISLLLMKFNDGGQLFKRGELPGEKTILPMMPIRELPGERILSWLQPRLPPLGNVSDSSEPPILPDNDANDDDLPELVEDNDDDNDDDLPELVEDVHFNHLLPEHMWFRHADFRERKPY